MPRGAAAQETPPLGPQDVALLETTIRLQEKTGAEVWPGFDSYRPVVLFFNDNGQFLLNAQTAPSYYQVYSATAPFWSKTSWWTKELRKQDGSFFSDDEFNKSVINSAYSSEETGYRFPYSIFLIDSLERYRRKGHPWTAEDWMAIFWHEVFHVYQDSQYKPELTASEKTSIEPIKNLLDDPVYLELLQQEQALMKEALLQPKLPKKNETVCQKYLPQRRLRHEGLKIKGRQGALQNELFYEVSEGTARYVEEITALTAAKLPAIELKKLDAGLYGGPDYSRFQKFKSRPLAYHYAQVDQFPQGTPYYYVTGFSLALLLDQLDPAWKKDIFQTENFFDAKLESYCQKYQQELIAQKRAQAKKHAEMKKRAQQKRLKEAKNPENAKQHDQRRTDNQLPR